MKPIALEYDGLRQTVAGGRRERPQNSQLLWIGCDFA